MHLTARPIAGHAHVSPEVFQESLPYAVIDFGGMKQYVEEGVTIALAKKDIAQVRSACLSQLVKPRVNLWSRATSPTYCCHMHVACVTNARVMACMRHDVRGSHIYVHAAC